MQSKQQSCDSLSRTISGVATAALAIAIVFALTVVLTQSAQAQKATAGGAWTEKVLHNFNHNGTDGYWPIASPILDAAGNLYGTTFQGGAYDLGTVFELTPTGGGWTETVLHTFSGYTDGGSPWAGLVFDTAGNLYGTTPYGGDYYAGTVFELTPTAGGGWTKQVLHSFSPDCTDGYEPYAGLIFDTAGNLYGTTSAGGTYSCNGSQGGTVFELTPTEGGGWTETVLHSFNSNGTDGIIPYASLVFDTAGNLYGTTVSGGTYNYGTVFKLSPGEGGWTETVLHTFNGTDGAAPYAGLIRDAAGNLYGTTFLGGAYGGGTVFELTPIYPCVVCNHSVSSAEVNVLPAESSDLLEQGGMGRP